jgi:hypothetical protein
MHVVKKKDKYIVSAIYGTKWSPVVEGYRVSGQEDLDKKIKQLKARPEVLQIRVQRDGLVSYLRAFTPMGEAEVFKALRTDKPNVTEVIFLDKPKGFFGVPRVRKEVD